MSGNILAVDDTPEVLQLLSVILKKEGYSVLTATSVRQASQVMRRIKPDLILMDVVLPDTLGTRFTQNLRKTKEFSDIPVILLTSKDHDADILKGFKIGADDYVSKPFNSAILLARVNAILRRHKPELFNSLVTIGPLKIDSKKRQIEIDSHPINLTPGEYAIICELVKNKNKPLNRQYLAKLINTQNTRVVDTHINAIRKKIGSARKYLRTVHGTGYKFLDLN